MQLSNVLTIAGMVIGLGAYGIGIAMWAGEKNKTIEVQDEAIATLSTQVSSLSSRVSIERNINLERDVAANRENMNRMMEVFNNRLGAMQASTDREIALLTEELEEMDEEMDQHWAEIQASATYAELKQLIDTVTSLQQEVARIRSAISAQ